MLISTLGDRSQESEVIAKKNTSGCKEWILSPPGPQPDPSFGNMLLVKVMYGNTWLPHALHNNTPHVPLEPTEVQFRARYGHSTLVISV